MSELIERAEGILKGLAAKLPSGIATPEAFADEIATSHPSMVRPLLASWASLIFELQRTLPQPEKPAASATLAPMEYMPPAPERTTVQIPIPNPPMSPSRGGETKQPLPSSRGMSSAPRSMPNPPRVPVAAIADANQRLGQSLLDAWQIGGKRFGDCRVSEVLEACNTRDNATRLMRAVVKDLPGNAVVRHALTPLEAESRRKAALAITRQPTTIEATKPEGYRDVG